MSDQHTTGRPLPDDLQLLLNALRGEFDAKLSNLKAWGLAMCLGGGTLGGIISAIVHPSLAHQAAARVLHYL